MKSVKRPVAILGAGPVGLAAAAHLAERGEPFVLLEAGESIAANIQSWKHVRMFSPWEYNVDKAAQALLEKHGWAAPPPEALPTGGELVDNYLRPLADLPQIKPYLHLNSKVIAVGRKGLDKMKTAGRDHLPFVIQYEQNGKRVKLEARAVIDATGTWNRPNPVGSGGVWGDGEAEANSQIVYGIPDVLGEQKSRYAGKRVLVVGSGHSAINTLLDLAKLQQEAPETTIFWAIRKQAVSQTYGGGEADALPARGALGLRLRSLVESGHMQVFAPFYIEKIDSVEGRLRVIGMLQEEEAMIGPVDQIIANTGSRPDMNMLREVRADFDPALECVPALAELIDPNIHSCGTVRPHGEAELRQPEKDLYIVGSKSYGRAPTFLLATGYEQVRSVVSALVGDWEAARKVELQLPETGVCSVGGGSGAAGQAAACCGPAGSEKDAQLVAAQVTDTGCCQSSLPQMVHFDQPTRSESSDCSPSSQSSSDGCYQSAQPEHTDCCASERADSREQDSREQDSRGRAACC
ncbi:NAD(P)-binding domain-containing protein [Brevibacillus humidisoli]|uniref:FAD-dependent oxidoreductase n=1 Tax=Brevibacillus humidisoli TaxID=2895522 RepID=UPI001E417DB0|nr:FAD-dependent oxidoreductase [Brevibacillus humidisoli]UFJ40811.1 NAD(P)-binding domain-containing protein [Brevibacillus humidisoli]